MKVRLLQARCVASAVCLAVLCLVPASAASLCDTLGYNNLAPAKSSKLYLYFPTADDAGFPEFGGSGIPLTSPARRFNVSDLSSFVGTDAQLRAAIADVVTDIFCEFDVEVSTVAPAPSAAPQRRSTIAIGSDRATNDSNEPQLGQADAVDTDDAVAAGFGRVWAGTYQEEAGKPGGALHGTKSTLERWAHSIGSTAAHEAGHTYGLSHVDGAITPRPQEDGAEHHLMADGGEYDYEQRAVARHFSDHEYSVLAYSVGLSVQTLFNWDLQNQNQDTATALTIEFLSQLPALTLASVYTGPLSPWDRPTVIPSLGTVMFRGVSYHRYRLLWDTPKAWSGGAAGEIAGGTSFHIGVSFIAVDFHTPESVIVTNTTLFDSSGSALPLHPRIPAFGAGTFAADGSLGVEVLNLRSQPALLASGVVQYLPRLVSIDAMVPKAERLFDPRGATVWPWLTKPLLQKPRVLPAAGSLRLVLAHLREGRRPASVVGPNGCERGDVVGRGRDTRLCRPGFKLGLFPATSVLVIANFVEPAAKQWDPRRNKYVLAPLRTTVHYQLAGRRPDLDRNGIDDYVDIASKRAQDKNRDGVVDHVQRIR